MNMIPKNHSHRLTTEGSGEWAFPWRYLVVTTLTGMIKPRVAKRGNPFGIDFLDGTVSSQGILSITVLPGRFLNGIMRGQVES